MSKSAKKQKAVFLDRDGVINDDHGYTFLPEDFNILEGVFPACRRFVSLGYKIIVVTNQSGIARGYYTLEDFETLTDHMLQLFKQQGITIDAVYHCPHHAQEGYGEYKIDCECRKPKPGMLIKAAHEHNIELVESIMIGDNISDILAGKAAGVKKCILISKDNTQVEGELADAISASLLHVRL